MSAVIAAPIAPSPIYLIDASVYVFRAYFSSPSEFVDREGQPVHAVHGFLGTLLSILEQARPSHVLVAFDASLTSSFRNRIYPAYKANRELPPADLERQFDHCRKACELLGLTALADAEYEADDLIGSALTVARRAQVPSVIVTSDKDLSQLIGAEDAIWDLARRERFGVAGVIERMGVAPHQVADLLGLTGDAVDNIPGVPGIGPKTAVPLLAHFGSLDALLARIDEVPFLRLRGAASAAAKLREHRQMALLCRQLAQIACDAPVPDTLAGYRRRPPDIAALDDLFDQLNFGPMLRRRAREQAG